MTKTDIKKYKKLLPEKLTVEIHKTDEGFWAKIREFSNCYTQASTLFELIKMVNDSVYTHLEIPKKVRTQVGFYMPDFIVDEFKRKHWDSVVSNIVKKEQKQKGHAVFQLSPKEHCVC